jgi:hypothetical protein
MKYPERIYILAKLLRLLKNYLLKIQILIISILLSKNIRKSVNLKITNKANYLIGKKVPFILARVA